MCDDIGHDICAVCKHNALFFTLRQRVALQQMFEGGIPSAEVSCFGRRGQAGSVTLVNEHGLCLDFGGPAPSIEAWDWDELVLAHLLPEDGESLDVMTAPTSDSLWQFRIGDAIMIRTGKVYWLNRRVKVKSGPPKFYANTGLWSTSVLISADNLPTIVDWLPKETALAKAS